MARVLSVLNRTSPSTPSMGAPPASPPARRPQRAWWRDARVVAGVALIVICMAIGARLLSGGDDTVMGWQAVRDLSAGAVVGDGDVVAVALPASVAVAYAADGSLPATPLDRPVRAGEFLPASSSASIAAARWVTVPIEPLHAPVDLAPGERVDVWSTPGVELGAVPIPELVLEGALVSDVAIDGVGLGGEYGVVLQIEPQDAEAVLAALRSGGIDLVRVPVVAS